MCLHSNRFRFVAGFLSMMVLLGGCGSSEPASRDELPATPPAVRDTVLFHPEILLPDLDREFRAAWIATVANIDWPGEPGLPADRQKEELTAILDRAAALHLNAVILQVRPAADAFYDSAYEPWSYFLSGKMGRPPLPEYDPLAFAVEEAHKRGLQLHAWFNPYRAFHPANSPYISPDHISRTHPDYVHRYGDYLWMDPGLPGVREHTIRVVLDVLERYDIDGIHFDDYFYPYPSYAGGADFPDSLSWHMAREAGGSLMREDWRRENVNRLIEELSRRIKQKKPDVLFGISPFGIWRPGHPERTTGFDAYDKLYADALHWLQQGWIDYLSPQLYYRISQIPQPFPVVLQWWASHNGHNRHIWPGLYTSRIRSDTNPWPQEEIIGQIYLTRGFPEAEGTVHFSMRALMENPGNINRTLSAGPYALPAVIPPSPWLDTPRPSAPRATIRDYGEYWSIFFRTPPAGENIQQWTLKTPFNDTWQTWVYPADRSEIRFYGGPATKRPEKVVVSSVNRTGRESDPVLLTWSDTEKEKTRIDTSGIIKPEIIKHSEWALSEPGGIEADAIRRNLRTGDTLHFRDLTVHLRGILHTAPVPGHLLKNGLPAAARETPAREQTRVRAELHRNGISETFTVEEGEALNWYGYHIGIPFLDPDSKTVQLEIATVASLPPDRAAMDKTGSGNNRFRVPHSVKRITLHHLGSPEAFTKDDDPLRVLRDLHEWSVTDRNWWDVPYHYLIDPDGTIYQGRDPAFAGDTNTGYDPRGHLQISVLGNYDLQKPEQAQLEAIARLMAWAVDAYGLTTDDISGHSGWADTSCPGKHLRSYLDDGRLQRMVEQRLERKE